MILHNPKNLFPPYRNYSHAVEVKGDFCDRNPMLRAVIFDFNGIIVDDEPIHFQLFQKTVALKKVKLTQEDYYQKYLGYSTSI